MALQSRLSTDLSGKPINPLQDDHPLYADLTIGPDTANALTFTDVDPGKSHVLVDEEGDILPDPTMTGATTDATTGATTGATASVTTSASDAVAYTSATTSPFVINVTYDSSVASAPAAFKTAVSAAVQYLQSQFTDAVSINITVGFGKVAGYTMPAGALGESMSYLSSTTYAALTKALAGDAKSATDTAAVASLGTANPSGGTVWLTTAQSKALALTGASTATDGYVGFSASNAFDYNAADGISAGSYDFFGTALHEFSEVMGRMMLNGGTIGSTANSYTLLDMFHYSAAGVRDFAASKPGYFSVDGGKTSLGAFNTISGGDAGDWASSMGNDSFDAFSASGVANTVSAADLTVLDAIGWNRAVATTVTMRLTTDTGASATDGITANAALTGTAAANAVVSLSEGGKTLGTATASSTGVWNYTPVGLAQGAHSITAAAGAATTTLGFTYDSIAPSLSIALVTDTGSSLTDRITSLNSVKGTADAGAVITLTEAAKIIATATADAQGIWTATLPSLAQGAHSLIARTTDVAGNTTSAGLAFTYDTVAPLVTIALVSDTGASATDRITANDALKGTTDANALVTFTEAGKVIGTTTASATGAWTYTPLGRPLGANSVTATSTDAAGNTGSATLAFTYAPVLPTGLSVNPVTTTLANAASAAGLAGGVRLTTLTQTGGVATDAFTYALGGTGVAGFTLTAAGNVATLATAAGGAPASVSTLTITTTDATLREQGATTKLAVIIGSAGADSINVASAAGDTATPALIYANAEMDTINAAGMSGHVWMSGGAGADRMTSGAGGTSFLYGSAGDSTPGGFDIISAFTQSRDLIDLTGLGKALGYAGQLSATATSLVAGAFGWQQSGGNTFVYVNTGTKVETLAAADMKIELTGTVGLAVTNFLHV